MSKSKTRLYFGKLHETTRERDLEKFVRGYGKIREISVKRGYGFVEFYDARDAEDVVYDLNGRDLLGERVIIEHAREPSRRDWGYNSHGSRGYSRPSRDYHSRRSLPIRTEHRLAVENLSSRVNWQELKEFFNKAGDVTFTDAHKRKTGIGIVEFATKDDMKNALRKLDGVELNGKKLKLAIEAVRSRSRSRSRGRRSRSRSPKRRHHHSRSRSPRRSHSQSPSKTGEEKQGSKSRSRSKSEERKSRSLSHEKEGDESNHESGRESSNGSPQRNGEDENGNEEEEDDDE